MAQTINVGKLDRELRAANIPIDGCASNGRIDFRAEATEAQKALAEKIKANHTPYDFEEERVNACPGPWNCFDELHEGFKALKASLPLADWSKMNIWMNRIQAIKDKYPPE